MGKYKCSNCGDFVRKNARVCPHCGVVFQKNSKNQREKVGEEESIRKGRSFTEKFFILTLILCMIHFYVMVSLKCNPHSAWRELSSIVFFAFYAALVVFPFCIIACILAIRSFFKKTSNLAILTLIVAFITAIWILIYIS